MSAHIPSERLFKSLDSLKTSLISFENIDIHGARRSGKARTGDGPASVEILFKLMRVEESLKSLTNDLVLATEEATKQVDSCFTIWRRLKFHANAVFAAVSNLVGSSTSSDYNNLRAALYACSHSSNKTTQKQATSLPLYFNTISTADTPVSKKDKEATRRKLMEQASDLGCVLVELENCTTSIFAYYDRIRVEAEEVEEVTCSVREVTDAVLKTRERAPGGKEMARKIGRVEAKLGEVDGLLKETRRCVNETDFPRFRHYENKWVKTRKTTCRKR